MVIGLYALKICALLHDIGKLECWARMRKPVEHVVFTYNTLEPVMGGELAEIAMRHHGEPGYEGYTPVRDEEWIIAIANDIASGVRDEHPGAPPNQVAMTFPLSDREAPVVLKALSPADLLSVHDRVKDALTRACSIQDARERFEHIYRELGKREDGELSLHDIPADVGPSTNDHSLWSHLKMTCAIATCIYLQYRREGGLPGREPDDYAFALIGGDADRIGAYLRRSLRLLDLRGGSYIVKEATQAAVDHIAGRLGPDCVIFAAGGNFLAIAPAFMADELMEAAKERFEKATEGELTITVCKVEGDGSELKRAFGRMWRRLRGEVRRRKLVRPVELGPELGAGLELCDACGRRPWKHVDPMRVRPYDMAPRPERLCEACYKRRLKGLEARAQLHLRARTLEDLEDEDGYVALIKADGDGIGRVFDGSKLEEHGREISPAKLDFLSAYIHRACERELRRVVEGLGGEVIYAGGDDLLAIVGGRDAFRCARAVHDTFAGIMHGQATMSLGVLIMKSHFPMYVALSVVSQLLDNAKGLEGKNGIDFEVVRQVGITSDDVSREARERLRARGLTARPYKWGRFRELLSALRDLMGLTESQIHLIADIMASGRPDSAHAAKCFVRSQVGRGLIGYEVEERLLRAIDDGMLMDMVMVRGRVSLCP